MISIVLIGLPYYQVRSVLFWFAGIPWLMEIAVFIYANYYFRIMTYIAERRKTRYRAIKQQYARLSRKDENEPDAEISDDDDGLFCGCC